MSNVFWMISWDDLIYFVIEIIVKCPENKFLGCSDFVFFMTVQEIFSKSTWLLPLPFKVSWDKLFENLKFDSVSQLSLSKASFFREMLC